MTEFKSTIDKNNDKYVVTPVLSILPIPPGSNTVKVCSVEQQSLRLNIPHKHKDIIIRGTMSYLIELKNPPLYAITHVLPDDWDYILLRYGKHPSFANGRIFIAKDEKSLEARAIDSETQELATMTGSAQLSEKDLASSNLNIDNDNGVSQVKVKRSK